MNQESLKDAYQAAAVINRSLVILQAIRDRSAKHPQVADLLREHARYLVFHTIKLAKLKETEPAVFQGAADLYDDVVRCGNRRGYSYLHLALQFGELTLMSFAPHWPGVAEALLLKELPGLDVSGVISAWDASENWFDFLDEFGRDLDVALERESSRLQAQVKADVANPPPPPPPPPFPVTVNGNQIVVEGEAFPVQPHFAQWVQTLLEARESRETVTSSQFEESPGCRGKNVSRQFDRLFEKVPPLRQLIRSKRGKGGGWYFS